ncbi:MAG: cytochrome b/b6 domain-containing protein [Bacteroidia bacterium]|nr:cytochrome b/b6 domain-containing protein [Bacteroidia bacterium]
MENKIYFYPVWLRLWHWSNALLILVLIVTGLSMQYSSFESPHIPFSLAVTIHNICGIILVFGYLVFITGNIISKNGRYYKMNLKEIGGQILVQFRYYLYGVFKGDKVPFPVNIERKFNPLQKFFYVMIMYIGIPLLIISGIGLILPQFIVSRALGVSGLLLTSLLHICVGFFVSIFLMIHIYFCTFGASITSNFKGMFNGWQETH